MIKELKSKIKNAIHNAVGMPAADQIDDLQNQLDWMKQHSDITKLKPATGFFRKKQRELVAFTEEFLEYAKEIDLHPFLVGGNLIGAVRHGGFIPWDDDMDLAITREESNRLIEFCKEKCVVDVYDGNWNDYSYEKRSRRMERMLNLYPDKYILDIWVNQLQLYKGTSVFDAQYIDFWPFDYYAESYQVEDHMRYLDDLLKKLHEINNVREIVSFLQCERKNNANIVEYETDIFFPGIDNHIGFGRTKRTKAWLYKNDVFPLQKIKYENTYFYAPNNIENYLGYDYPDYMNYPKKIEINPHEKYKDTCLANILPLVGLLVQTIQDVEYFIPLHEYFEAHGIYSFFIRAIDEKNDYLDSALRMYERLEKEEVRYRKELKVKCYCVCIMNGRQYPKEVMDQTHIVYSLNQSDLCFDADDQSYKSFEEIEEYIKEAYSADKSRGRLG